MTCEVSALLRAEHDGARLRNSRDHGDHGNRQRDLHQGGFTEHCCLTPVDWVDRLARYLRHRQGQTLARYLPGLQ